MKLCLSPGGSSAAPSLTPSPQAEEEQDMLCDGVTQVTDWAQCRDFSAAAFGTRGLRIPGTGPGLVEGLVWSLPTDVVLSRSVPYFGFPKKRARRGKSRSAVAACTSDSRGLASSNLDLAVARYPNNHWEALASYV